MRKFLIKVNSQQYEVELEEIKGSNVSKPTNGASVKAAAPAPAPAAPAAPAAAPAPAASGKGNNVVAPMPGSILKVNVKAGDAVKRGQVLLVLEAMKMENEITAPADGKVSAVKVAAGQCISAGETLVVLQ